MRVLHIFVGKCRRCQNLKLRLVGIFIIINIYSDKDITIILKSTLILKTVFNIRKSLIIYRTFDTSMWKINDSGHIKNFCQITTKALCQLWAMYVLSFQTPLKQERENVYTPSGNEGIIFPVVNGIN